MEEVWDTLTGKKPVVRHEKLSPESVQTNQTIQGLAFENAELKGEKAALLQELGARRQADQDANEEKIVKQTLIQRNEELQAGTKVNFFSLKKFFAILEKNKPFANNLKIMTWDRKTILSRYTDFGFSQDGDFVLLGENNKVMMKAGRLKDIFQSPSAIENDIMAGMMVINLDNELGFVENIQTTQIQEIVPNGEGGFYYSPAKKKPLYQYVAELQGIIADKDKEIEVLEETSIKLKQENDEIKRANRVLAKAQQMSSAEKSEMEMSYTSLVSMFGETSKELMLLRSYTGTIEEAKEMMEQVVIELRSKAEREGSKLPDEKAAEKLELAITKLNNTIIPLAMNIKTPASPTQSQKGSPEGGSETQF